MPTLSLRSSRHDGAQWLTAHSCSSASAPTSSCPRCALRLDITIIVTESKHCLTLIRCSSPVELQLWPSVDQCTSLFECLAETLPTNRISPECQRRLPACSSPSELFSTSSLEAFVRLWSPTTFTYVKMHRLPASEAPFCSPTRSLFRPRSFTRSF